MVGKAESRIKKATWYGEHIRSYTAISKEQAEVVLLGDSIVANLARYPAVWDHLEKKKKQSIVAFGVIRHRMSCGGLRICIFLPPLPLALSIVG